MAQRESIKAALGVKEVERFESYLGLPTLIGWAISNFFVFKGSGLEKDLRMEREVTIKGK